MTSLPIGWWDQVLDGQPWHVSLDDIGFTNLATFRAAVYREAEIRKARVTTHKVGIAAALVQAYGAPGMWAAAPMLRHYTSWMPGDDEINPAPPPSAFRPLRHRVPQTVAVEAAPAPAVREYTDDELLGPCTCGLAPICLPTCARAN